MEALTKSGRIIIEGGKITLKREGIVGAMASILSILMTPLYFVMGVNTDSVIDISKVERVEYTKGVPHIIRPHMKVYYGKPRPRLVLFKRPVIDLANREGALEEMEKVVNELNRLGIKTIEAS